LQEGDAIRAADLNDFKLYIHPTCDLTRDISVKAVNLVAFIEGAKGWQGRVDADAQTLGRQDLVQRPCDCR